MPRHQNPYTSGRATRRARRVNTQTIGSHASTGARGAKGDFTYAENIARRARIRRLVIILIIVALVAGFAIAAGTLAFRGVVGSSLSLKDSDAADALSAAKSGEPEYILIATELGAVAASLDNEGPDILLLARVDAQQKSIALISVPPTLQVTTDNRSEDISDMVRKGDAYLINIFENFSKIDVNHYIKISQDGFVDMVDALGGIDVNLDTPIDDPQAGNLYIEAGEQTLDGEAALVYLRSTNVKMGTLGRIDNQLDFATSILKKLFDGTGFHARLEAIDSCFQTDMTLSSIESIGSWLSELQKEDIVCMTVPGYLTETTNVEGSTAGRYIATSSDFTAMLEDIAEGRAVSNGTAAEASTVAPSSFSLEIRNGTSINGAAALTAEKLQEAGFNVEEIGNADQPVFEETLVVYKDDEDKPKAQTVIDALGLGRTVPASIYYTFETDILLIVGSDYKPTS